MTDKAQISIVRGSDTVTIVGGGILDFTNDQEFQDGLKAASNEAVSVVVDLRTAEFIDTAVVQDLARAAVTLINRGKRLKVLVDENAYPYRVLQISGFQEIMDIEAEALEV